MKYWQLVFFFICFASAQEMSTAHFRVIYDSEDQRPFAEQIAQMAESALATLEPLFGLPDKPVVLVLEDETDSYNAFATLLPRPNIHLRSLFPLDGGLGFGAENDLFLLLIHELTHITQLSYTGSEPLRIGLPSDGNAVLPPPWFVEGIAVYVETAFTDGGRAKDARTLGLLYSKADAEDFPDLTDISLSSFTEWPYGAARYLYGGHFVSYLVGKYGFDAILKLLKNYNASLLPISFSAAWQAANGTALADEWHSWQEELKVQASSKQALEDKLLTDTGSVSSPSVSPDGKRLAWVSGSSVIVADLANGELNNPQAVESRLRPQSLSWLDDKTLVYNRSYRQPENTFNELFSFDLDTKIETKLSSGARAFFPTVSPEGCIYFVKDDPIAGSSLLKHCDTAEEVVFQTQPQEHILGLAVSKAGQLAVSLWRQGFVDLALLDRGKLRFLSSDPYQDLYPQWDGENALIFSSDREGIFDLYRLTVDSQELHRLSHNLGGAFEAIVTQKGIIYTAQTSKGYDLAFLEEPLAEKAELVSETPRENLTPSTAIESHPYNPLASLLPYAWYPSEYNFGISPFELGLGASVIGQDDSGRHSYSLNLSYDTAQPGPVAGLGLNAEYGYQDNVDPFRLKTYPFGVQMKAGLFRHSPHLIGSSETAFGVQTQLRLSQPLDKWSVYGLGRLGLIYLSSFNDWQLEGLGNAIVSQRSEDDWGYVSSGMRFGVTGIWSATSKGASPGLWANGTYYLPVSATGLELDGTLEFALRLGYRQAPPVPLGLYPWAASSSLGYRYSYPTEWRYEDGLFSLERLTLEARLRSWYDGNLGLGGDITLNADTILSYNAPVTFSVTLGYSQLFWYRVGLGFPLD